MKLLFLAVLILLPQFSPAQEKTDASLFMKRGKHEDLNAVESKNGNMFRKVGHHGPAIENEWFAVRLYFNKTTAVDLYSKSKAGLELAGKRWYPSKKDQKKGWGADYYKVGKSCGLGGIKLWDGNRVIPLNPVTSRSVKVWKEGGNAYMEMLSAGIPCNGVKVDILVRLTAFADSRLVKVEAQSATGTAVRFVTGINYHKGIEVVSHSDYIATWGIHPEDVAAEKIAVGAALLYNENDFSGRIDDGRQVLLISRPGEKLVTWITSCNEKEPEMNSLEKLTGYIGKNWKFAGNIR